MNLLDPHIIFNTQQYFKISHFFLFLTATKTGGHVVKKYDTFLTFFKVKMSKNA